MDLSNSKKLYKLNALKRYKEKKIRTAERILRKEKKENGIYICRQIYARNRPRINGRFISNILKTRSVSKENKKNVIYICKQIKAQNGQFILKILKTQRSKGAYPTENASVTRSVSEGGNEVSEGGLRPAQSASEGNEVVFDTRVPSDTLQRSVSASEGGNKVNESLKIMFEYETNYKMFFNQDIQLDYNILVKEFLLKYD
jgi:hypothetical protein